MADKHQAKATLTIKSAGLWTEKFVDLHFKDKKGKITTAANAVVREYPLKGRPDMYYFGKAEGNSMVGGFIEVKSGQGEHHQRFDFAEWRSDQREWYDKYGKHMIVWTFLVLGESVKDKRYPLVAFLFPTPKLIELEAEIGLTRKSIAYDDALSALNFFKLHWVIGRNHWAIPTLHPFLDQFKR